MRSDIEPRFGKTRQRGSEHYFRVQVSLGGRQRFTDALVMKRDDRDGPTKHDRPYRVEWAATGELERKAKAALDRLEERFSAKHTKNALKRFLKKDVPSHCVPPDAEVPVDLGMRIRDARFRFESRDGPPAAWEQEADAAALRRAEIAARASESSGISTNPNPLDLPL